MPNFSLATYFNSSRPFEFDVDIKRIDNLIAALLMDTITTRNAMHNADALDDFVEMFTVSVTCGIHAEDIQRGVNIFSKILVSLRERGMEERAVEVENHVVDYATNLFIAYYETKFAKVKIDGTLPNDFQPLFLCSYIGTLSAHGYLTYEELKPFLLALIQNFHDKTDLLSATWLFRFFSDSKTFVKEPGFLLELIAGLHSRCRLLFGAHHTSEEEQFASLIYTAMFHRGSVTLNRNYGRVRYAGDDLENKRLKSPEYEPSWSWSPPAEDLPEVLSFD